MPTEQAEATTKKSSPPRFVRKGSAGKAPSDPVKTKKKTTETLTTTKLKGAISCDGLIDSVAKSLGKSFAVEMMDASTEDSVPYYIPFRHHGLQAITGGVPGGMMTVIEGDSQCGKSFLLYELIVQCILMGGYAFLSDPENALQPRFMKRVGLGGTGRFIYTSRENQLARTFMMWRKFVMAVREKDKKAPILIGADSYPAMQIKLVVDELDKKSNSTTGEKRDELTGYLQARKNAEFSQLLGEFVGFMSENKVALVFINQLRQKIGMVFGDPTTTNAETVFKYYATLRMRGRLGKKIKESSAKAKEGNARQVGVRSIWETIKNRNVEPFKKVETKIIYKTGVDRFSGLADLLDTEGKIAVGDGGFIFNKVQYLDQDLADFVAKHPEALIL
jgi:recombination protein RecA